MTDVRPFRALRYDPKRVDLARVLTPPYDVISPDDRRRLWDGDPHCAVRLILARQVADEADTDYADVGERLARWQREGVLVRDGAPALYALSQRFEGPDGRPLERLGFFAALRLEEYGRGVVRPHEQTLSGPKQDRLKLLRATRTNLSPVFCLYEDREQRLNALLTEALKGSEGLRTTDSAGVEHAMVSIGDAEVIEGVREFLAERPVVIADGHHRYETALAYRDERLRAQPDAGEDAPFRFLLTYFANAFAPGSLLLPIHRALRGPAPDPAGWRERLPGWREEGRTLPDAEAIERVLAGALAPLADRHAFAVDDGSGRLRIFSRPADGELGVRVVHREVLGGVCGLDEEAVRGGAVDFPKSALQAARDVRAGRGRLAIYLNPLRPDDVFRVTAAGERLPQKSTFFQPKLPVGLLFRPLDEEGA